MLALGVSTDNSTDRVKPCPLNHKIMCEKYLEKKKSSEPSLLLNLKHSFKYFFSISFIPASFEKSSFVTDDTSANLGHFNNYNFYGFRVARVF